MPAIRAIICDFDGLILETEGACFASWRELFSARGQSYTLEDYRAIVGTHDSALDPRSTLEERCGAKFDRDALEVERRAHEVRLGAALVVLPGVVALLTTARERGLRLGVASNSSHTWVDRHLANHGLASFFDTTVCRDDTVRVKPDPDIYLEVIRRLDVAPGEAIAFEDSHTGSLAAKRAGLWCVAVPSEITETQDFSHVDLRVPTLDGLDLDALLARFTTSTLRAQPRVSLP